ncbi:hypothetical protein SAMN04487949_3034 [Halogranum gelatinilyticum]|uniref:DUF7968 domain-containing protein n=1 Tax=Halogranum gelatinilyticum TaxID=660521 RepID=A0A1G9XLN7_9EURY|nr:hypothetical protein [Halogranum gelatinilyticum]SDM97411.1 hypothetical protein SAMN04487949_3034 [Halogranum gelatinilyticum]
MAETRATRVVVSHPTALSDWGRDQLTSDRYVNYLRKTLGRVHAGDEFEEFLDVGCCGDSLDVPLRVEAVDGGREVGMETTVEFVERDVPMDGGWRVQSAAGPEDA